MSALPQANDLVLVAFVPQPRDLEIARLLGWYRIPLRSAPRVVAVDWLAFYQPGSFPAGERWLVRQCAAVRGHELVTRAQLFKDEADSPKAHHEYFKIALGPLQSLPAPVPAERWKRLTFLYTTGERLLAAESLSELGVHDEERQVLFQALRERAQQAQAYTAGLQAEFPLDPALLAYIGLQAGGAAYFEELDS